MWPYKQSPDLKFRLEFFALKVASDTTFLSYTLNNLEEILHTSYYTLDLKSTKKFPNPSTDQQPKFKIRTLRISDGDWCGIGYCDSPKM